MSPQRIQLRRTKGWRKPEGAVVVARPTKWGNPYTLKTYDIDYPDTDAAEKRRMATSDFRGMVEGKWDFAPNDCDCDWCDDCDYPDAREIRAELRGRDLACWCPLDQPCHADVLLEIANGDAP